MRVREDPKQLYKKNSIQRHFSGSKSLSYQRTSMAAIQRTGLSDETGSLEDNIDGLSVSSFPDPAGSYVYDNDEVGALLHDCINPFSIISTPAEKSATHVYSSSSDIHPSLLFSHPEFIGGHGGEAAGHLEADRGRGYTPAGDR